MGRGGGRLPLWNVEFNRFPNVCLAKNFPCLKKALLGSCSANLTPKSFTKSRQRDGLIIVHTVLAPLLAALD